MLQIVRVERADEKQGHLFSLYVPFLNCKSIKAFYMYAYIKKLPIRIAHQTFLENKHPEVTKNSYYVLSLERGPKKGISSWTNSDYLNKTAKIKDQANQRISV